MLKAQMKILPSSRVTRIHTMGASKALWIMAEKRYLCRGTHIIVKIKSPSSKALLYKYCSFNIIIFKKLCSLGYVCFLNRIWKASSV